MVLGEGDSYRRHKCDTLVPDMAVNGDILFTFADPKFNQPTTTTTQATGYFIHTPTPLTPSHSHSHLHPLTPTPTPKPEPEPDPTPHPHTTFCHPLNLQHLNSSISNSRRSKQHVKLNPRIHNRISVSAAKSDAAVPGAEEASIEKVRAFPTRLSIR